ncbi:extracellular solute-binding protein [Tamlana sp. 2_MG-2023]|uniref:ABC transporter substrate-binding protein n=1 Tax=unclassified Tamlana TaxID=2614803 RepID=UPI0026E2AD7A|nr:MULTISPECIES: extracellular solute-binding protein [unclassified Tamlana]MDO6761315.1 extracellular solute-binding protein [Tamlana sp. 2_MG-2023]MDO6791798.1 extracellular solute-binding protein [Tamlana sp. 1_MG-2023]
MSQKNIQLKGITWDHSRGFTSAVATAQRFHELNPHVEITWEKRSLQAFADEPIDQLAKRYDLLIIDHPWAGFAARTGVIIPLNEHLPKAFLDNQAANSVGKSHESYCFDGYQSALAIDAATPVAASRPDLLEKIGKETPKTWEDLMDLAKKGLVAIPGIPQDTLMSFYMICSTLGEDVALTKNYFVSEKIGLKALEILGELGKHIDPSCYDMNPIKVYEAMTRTDKFAYSPFAYGYTNYSKRGYANHILKFHDTVTLEGQHLITTLGGTGLAISSSSENKDIALQYAEYTASPEVQKTVFFDYGGQPGHREAWLDTTNNFVSLDYFKDTLPTLDRAFLRPRYHGHMYFQDRAGAPIREFMKNGGSPKDILDGLNDLYLESLKK